MVWELWCETSNLHCGCPECIQCIHRYPFDYLQRPFWLILSFCISGSQPVEWSGAFPHLPSWLRPKAPETYADARKSISGLVCDLGACFLTFYLAACIPCRSWPWPRCRLCWRRTSAARLWSHWYLERTCSTRIRWATHSCRLIIIHCCDLSKILVFECLADPSLRRKISY